MVDKLVDLGDRPGVHRPGGKLLTLIHAIIAAADCIDDADLLGTGQTAQVLGLGFPAFSEASGPGSMAEPEGGP